MLRTLHRTALFAATAAAIVTAGCGDLVRDGRGPMQATVSVLEGASGAEPTKFGGTIYADVLTFVQKDENGVKVKVPTIFSDLGRVNMGLILKNPGTGNTAASPTPINQVTFNRYRVVYTRADGRNTPGVDVPYAFDSAATFTATVDTPGSAGFEIVRHTAKQEPPLRALTANTTIISTIAEVTFYGEDRAGNDVSASGKIGINFGDFGDPE